MKIEKLPFGSYRMRKMYKGYYLKKVEETLGIQRSPLHKLRHYFASKMSTMNVPGADIIKMGRWKTDHVMKAVYRHSMMEKEESAKRDAAENLRKALFS